MVWAHDYSTVLVLISTKLLIFYYTYWEVDIVIILLSLIIHMYASCCLYRTGGTRAEGGQKTMLSLSYIRMEGGRWPLGFSMLLFYYSTIHSPLLIHILFIHHIQSSIYSYIKLTLNHCILGVGIPVAKHGMITVVPALTI